MSEASDFMDRVRSHRDIRPNSAEAERVAQLLQQATGISWSLNNPDDMPGEGGLPVAIVPDATPVSEGIGKIADAVSVARARHRDPSGPVKFVAQKVNLPLLEQRVANLTGGGADQQGFAGKYGKRGDFGPT